MDSSHAGIVVVRTALWPCLKALKLASAGLESRARSDNALLVPFDLRDDTRNVFDENGVLRGAANCVGVTCFGGPVRQGVRVGRVLRLVVLR